MGGWWLITGSVVFLVGAAVAVSRVFTESDRRVRLAMLEEHQTSWQLGQPLYAVGPLLVGLGVAVRAAAATGGAALVLAASAVLLLAGAVCWSVIVALRGVRWREFALGELPGWPFAAYVLLTCAGLAALGAGLLLQGLPGWLGWPVVLLAAAFLVGYLVADDLPPFVFYLVTLVVGVALVAR